MQMHEQTQRFILLLIFYLFGPILTLGIIGGVAVRKLPSHARSWERYFTQQSGLHWTIQSVEYCSPGFVRLHTVKILDETAQHVLFNAKTVDVRLMTGTRQEEIFPGKSSSGTREPAGLTGVLASLFPSLDSTNQFWQISVPASYLDFGKYSSEDSALLVQNMLRKLFVRFNTLSEVPIRFVFEEIAVVSEYSLKNAGNKIEDKVDIFRFVQGNIYRTPSEIRSDWSFQIRGVSEFDRERLSFVLAPGDSLDIVFRTEKQPIPCDLAAVFCVPFKFFSGGSFQGEFSLSTRNGTHSQTIRLNQVVFTNVPLDPLVRSYTDFTVRGTVASLWLKQAVFGTEGTYAEGALNVVDGAVDTSLFLRCKDHFQLTMEPEIPLDSSTRMIPFTGCAVLFRLQPRDIDFWADQKWYDVFMYYNAGDPYSSAWKVRFPSERRAVTYHELMSVFAADGTPVVPLTSGLKPILSVLPIP